MSRPWLRVRAYAPHLYVVNGPGAGRLVIDAGGKVMYSRSMRGYATNEQIATQVLALAEHERRAVTFEDHRTLKLVDLSPEPGEPRNDPEADQLGFDLGDAS